MAEHEQLLHLVFGGELTDPGTVTFADVEKLHIVGIFPSYQEAYAAWRAVTGMTVDDAHVRYFIVHLHRILDPGRKPSVGGDEAGGESGG